MALLVPVIVTDLTAPKTENTFSMSSLDSSISVYSSRETTWSSAVGSTREVNSTSSSSEEEKVDFGGEDSWLPLGEREPSELLPVGSSWSGFLCSSENAFGTNGLIVYPRFS